MANANKINGFSPVGYLSGAPYTGAARMYAIPTADTTASYAVGDIVRSRGSSDTFGVPYAIKIPAAEASSFVALGVIVGLRVVDPGASLQATPLDLGVNWIVSGTRTSVRYIMVADDPNLVFEAFVGSAGIINTSARKNFGIASYYSGADQTYAIDQNASVTTLTQSSPYSNIVLANVNTTNTLPIQCLGLSQIVGNNTITGTASDSAYARVLCRFNTHEFGVSTGTGHTGL
jgi:hypothetical protein